MQTEECNRGLASGDARSSFFSCPVELLEPKDLEPKTCKAENIFSYQMGQGAPELMVIIRLSNEPHLLMCLSAFIYIRVYRSPCEGYLSASFCCRLRLYLCTSLHSCVHIRVRQYLAILLYPSVCLYAPL